MDVLVLLISLFITFVIFPFIWRFLFLPIIIRFLSKRGLPTDAFERDYEGWL